MSGGGSSFSTRLLKRLGFQPSIAPLSGFAVSPLETGENLSRDAITAKGENWVRRLAGSTKLQINLALHSTFAIFVGKENKKGNMRLVIQRVKEASVTIDGQLHSAISAGLMVLVGVAEGDTVDDARWLAAKTVAMRIFDDEQGVMNRSVADVGGEVLAVSQFTLNASTKKGNRPSYIHAAGHDVAVPLYDAYCTMVEEALGRETKKGVFGADMQVALINDGPVTIIIDSKLRE